MEYFSSKRKDDQSSHFGIFHKYIQLCFYCTYLINVNGIRSTILLLEISSELQVFNLLLFRLVNVSKLVLVWALSQSQTLWLSWNSRLSLILFPTLFTREFYLNCDISTTQQIQTLLQIRLCCLVVTERLKVCISKHFQVVFPLSRFHLGVAYSNTRRWLIKQTGVSGVSKF